MITWGTETYVSRINMNSTRRTFLTGAGISVASVVLNDSSHVEAAGREEKADVIRSPQDSLRRSAFLNAFSILPTPLHCLRRFSRIAESM